MRHGPQGQVGIKGLWECVLLFSQPAHLERLYLAGRVAPLGFAAVGSRESVIKVIAVDSRASVA